MKPLAKALLERFGSLGAVLAAPAEELTRFELVNQQTIANFRAIRELAARMAREELIDQPLLNSIDKVVDYCRAKMAHSEVEEFRVLYLDQRNALIHDELQQRGTVNEVAAYPREIMRRALNLGAVGLVLCHNHPSGNLKPSARDIEITREIVHAAEGSASRCTITSSSAPTAISACAISRRSRVPAERIPAPPAKRARRRSAAVSGDGPALLDPPARRDCRRPRAASMRILFALPHYFKPATASTVRPAPTRPRGWRR